MADVVEIPVAARRDRLGWLLLALALLAVLLHGTQLSIDLLAKPGKKGPSLNLTPADVVIGLAFIVWCLRRMVRLDFSMPPVFLPLGGVIWLLLSLVPMFKGAAGGISTSGTGWVKVFQFFEYFIAAYVVFWEVFREERARRWLVCALSLSVVAALVLAAVQYASGGALVTQVRGTGFADRNTFGAFLAMTVPLLYGTAVFSFSLLRRPIATLLVVASLCLVLAGGPFLALVAGLLTVAMLKGRFRFIRLGLLILLVGGLLLPHLPRRNTAVLLDSVALYKEFDPHRVFQVSDGTNPFEVKAQDLADKSRALDERIRKKEPVQYGEAPSEEDYSYKWQQRCKEWQAALNMMAASPLFGVGWGSYQANVNMFYGGIPKPNRNLLEPDTLSGYMVWGASAGVPFLLIMLALGLHAGKSAAQRFWADPQRFSQGMSAGVLGALAALAVLGIFTDPLVRGLGITMALLFALAHALRAGRPEAMP